MIVRQDGIGDALVLLPVVAALRAAGHELGIVLSTRNAGLFAKRTFVREYVTERIPWPRHGSTDATYGPALEQIRADRYDVALVASEEPEAYRIAHEAGIRRRIGFWNGLERPFKSLWIRIRCTEVVRRSAALEREPLHEAQTLFRLGAQFVQEREPTTDSRRLRPLLLDEDVPVHGDLVVQLTAKWRAIGVNAGGVRAMLTALRERYTVRTIAPPEELDDPRTFDPDVFITRTPQAWKSAVASAAVVVSPDTGTAHLAGMLGIPTIDVFPDGPDAPAQWSRWHPWASPAQQLLTRGEPEGFASDVREAVDRFMRLFADGGESDDEIA